MRVVALLAIGLALADRRDQVGSGEDDDAAAAAARARIPPHNHIVVLVSEVGDDDRLERCGVQTGVVRGDTQIWPALPSEGPATVRCPLRAAIRYANAVRRGVAVTLRLAPGFYAVRAEPLPLVTRDLVVVGADAPLDEHRAGLEATLANLSKRIVRENEKIRRRATGYTRLPESSADISPDELWDLPTPPPPPSRVTSFVAPRSKRPKKDVVGVERALSTILDGGGELRAGFAAACDAVLRVEHVAFRRGHAHLGGAVAHFGFSGGFDGAGGDARCARRNRATPPYWPQKGEPDYLNYDALRATSDAGPRLMLENCDVFDGAAAYGAGVYTADARVFMEHVNLVGNTATRCGGAWHGDDQQLVRANLDKFAQNEDKCGGAFTVTHAHRLDEQSPRAVEDANGHLSWGVLDRAERFARPPPADAPRDKPEVDAEVDALGGDAAGVELHGLSAAGQGGPSI